jgi:peptidoglycan glycosyltransferase
VSGSPVTLLVVVALFFVAAVTVEKQAEAARAREDLGLTRGLILDAAGSPIARTMNHGGQARRLDTLPDATAIIGYRDRHGRWQGLEGRYNAILTARHARADWRSFFLHLRGTSNTGDNLQLTIDSGLQRVAARALGRHAGAVVALNPRTGAVLALAGTPECRPPAGSPSSRVACSSPSGGTAISPAIGRLFVPGSTFKIVTLSAALGTGRFHLTDTFSGPDVFGPSPYFDNSTYPSNVTRSDLTVLSLAQALAFSDNFTFAHIGLTLGAPTLLRYARSFSIGRRVPFDLPVAVSHVADGSPHPSTAQLARSSFGAPDDRVTPLQMAMIASAVANRGVLMDPYLVRSVIAPDGRVLQRTVPHSLDRVMSPSAARAVTDGMVFVVNFGSGFEAQIHGIAVAGKTGTAAGAGAKPDAWFISFAPAYHPIVAVAVLRENSGEGFEYAAPIARQMLVAALREHGYHVH